MIDQSFAVDARRDVQPYGKVFDDGPLGMCLVGSDLRYVDANEAYCRITGYTLNELRQRTFRDITHPEDVDGETQLATRLFEGSVRSYQIEKRYLHRRGGVVWANLHVSTVADDDGRRLALAMIEDISERKRAQVQLERTNAELQRANQRLQRRTEMDGQLAEAARAVSTARDVRTAFASFTRVLSDVVPFDWAALAVPDSDRRVRVALVTGDAADALPAGSLIDAGKPDLRAALEAGRAYLRRDLQAGEPSPVDEQLLARGLHAYVAVPIRVGGEVTGAVMLAWADPVGCDLDDVPLLEAFVREAAGALSTLLLLEQERTIAQSLRELDRLKNDFVGVVVHDLRGPLALVAGYADLLRDDWGTLDEAAKLHYLDRIRRTAHDISERVGEILMVARIDSGEIPCEPSRLDLAGVVDRAVADACTEHPDRRCVVDLEPGLEPAHADRSHTRRILRNLLANALKFSPADSNVRVSVRRSGDEIVVSVRDQGMGIAPQDADKLFRKFSRLGGGGRPDGTGLGLYVCKALAEAQRGRIWFDSVPGQGSTFSFTVPVA
ncbi:MAG: PAS domain S-box protein [Actinobacteria bacterium]|nr:PAS domain S-box protein [Actinomycetota bacterium]